MDSRIRAALDDARRRLAEIYGDRIVRVILYGSQARGDAHADSDVDVLVVLRGPVNILAELRRISPLKLDLLGQYNTLISFQPFSEKIYQDHIGSFMENIYEEGILL